ncbi:hypothetical protein VI817_003084 [Penicillium citrinum]|nr:hypothetical protein VI817_003084 [Penicillium citrinum]
MAEPPPELSFTPPGTPLSTAPHYYQVDSMDLVDPEGARTPKRQRVDSGSGAHENLSIEAASNLPSTSTPSVVPATNVNLNLNSNSNHIQSPTSPTSTRPSKVTINMKSPNGEMNDSPNSPSPTPLAASHRQSSPDTTPAPNNPNSNAASLFSSPEASPQIEIADPEDMGQDPNTSNWRPLEDVVTGDPQADPIDISDVTPLVDLFPIRGTLSAYDTLRRMAQLFEHGGMHHASSCLEDVQIWLTRCAQSPNRLTPQTYLEDQEFWEQVPLLVEALLKRKYDTTSQMPIDRHPTHQYSRTKISNDGVGTLSCLKALLSAYVTITLHLLEMDTAVLRHLIDDPEHQTPISMSQRYLQSLSWIVSFAGIPFYILMERIYGADCRSILLDIRAQVLGPFNSAERVTEHCALVLEIIPKHPQITQMLSYLIAVLSGFLDSSLESYTNEAPDEIIYGSGKTDVTPSTVPEQLYTMLKSVDLKYQEWIAKKSPCLSSEYSENLQRQIPRAMIAFCRRSDDFIQKLSTDLSIDLPDDTDSEENTRILTELWKFGVLKKQIMEGRMELRVHGVEKMQSELINVWKENICQTPDGVSSPFVQSLVRFIKGSKIVDYLVGVDSHPQLISRSSNIVGFLVVTSTYTDHETDIIWKAVTESQDNRIVSEVLSMLVRTFYMHTTASPALLYICEKVSTLPLDRFDSHVLELCNTLLGQTIATPNQGHTSVDQPDPKHAHAIPLRLCVRLIRESTVAEGLSADQRTQLQTFGSNKLTDFIKAGISDDDRMEMYERCIQDIAEMNRFTTGSIHALNALIPQWDTQEIRKLATDFDLTRLVINDMLNTVTSTNFDFADGFSQYGLVSRLEILFRLISLAPETITPELGSALWNEILLSTKMGSEGHLAVWAMMVSSLRSSTSLNPFLDRCIQDYMSHLTPKDYDHELFLFAKQSVNYEIRFKPTPTAGENEVVFIPGMDRIWDIILTAPPGTIEAEATKFAIEVYLDHQIIRNSPRSAVEATHFSIVGRCVDQLKSSAANMKSRTKPEAASSNGSTAMDTGGESHEDQLDELMFKRSLLFLHQLLDGLRSRPRYSPPQGPPPALPQRPLKGNALDIRWQSFNGGTSSKIQLLRTGDLSTASELVERLTQLTGFSKFTIIGGGARLDLLEKPETPLKDIKALQSGLLMIRKAQDAEELHRTNKGRALTSLDSEVMKHFDEIYPFLALSEDLAQQTFSFLITFPPKDWAMERVKSQDRQASDLFPFDQPYVARYMLHTLRHCIDDEASEVSPNYEFIRHSVDVLLQFLMTDELSNFKTASALATTAVELLLRLITMYPLENHDLELFPEPQPLVKRLLYFIERPSSAQAPPPIIQSEKLVCHSFAIIVEASMRDHKFWMTVKREIQVDDLLQKLLLKQGHQTSRNDVAEQINKACGSPSKQSQKGKGVDGRPISISPAENPSHIDMLVTIWQSLVKIIPNTLDYATQSAEFFKVCQSVFQTVTGSSHCDVTLDEYVAQWSDVLFKRLALRTEEFVGRETVDHLVFGLADLLEKCLETADLAHVDIQTPGIGERILCEHLFPDLSPDTSSDIDRLINPQVPVLHTGTRHKLLSIVYWLSRRDDSSVTSTIKQLAGLIPRDQQCNGSWVVDRARTLRAPEGYAGLTNLSNTCYLNSLMTQLFMNIEFRDFIMKLQFSDSISSQRLLDQTQKVFALMQNSWLKSVDPVDFVESIRTYDNEAIDVTIQMDVDEFYNLLFDRWEAQIADGEEKKKFRSFYGGQLVQQIKSQECPHISERLEPFSAIQCDIKGKANLEESLQAYVEGEIMQGDNKYSCTSCGRHVDAVKRACLKEVPDNLIFHLKRFDFDMVTMLRSKINDQFKFPQTIDMSPYNVEYLSDPDHPVEPDTFELVGVLVHTGTAESGHYYSYTRERPDDGNTPSWVEFNDADVTRFDPSHIADQCFGGPTEAMHNVNGAPINKLWNAYMLFYQRVSSIEKSREIYKPANPGWPVRTSVPIPLANHITMANEIFIRFYCLLDPVYTSLVAHQLQQVQAISESYPDKQRSELLAVTVGLDTFEQLVARNKGHLGLDNIVTELYSLLRRSPNTASRGLWWFCEHPTSISNLVLKTANPDAMVRLHGLNLLITALEHYQKALPQMDLGDDERETSQIQLERIVENIVDLFEDLWPNILTVARAWDDYFEFFCRLAAAGIGHVGVMLDHGILVKCLDVLWLDVHDKAGLRGSYLHYSRLVEKGRRFSYEQLMNLCTVLLMNIDLSLDPVPSNEQRALTSGKYPPNIKEAKILTATNDGGCLSLLVKIFQNEQLSDLPNARHIIASYLASEPDAGLLDNIVKTLEAGLRMSPADVCIPYLEAALVFCKESPDEASVLGMIDHVAKGVDSINNVAGTEHLEFFIYLCGAENERVGLSRVWFNSAVQERIPDFAPPLLIDIDRTVRKSTFELVCKLLFVPQDQLTDDAKIRYSLIAHELLPACLMRVSRSFTEVEQQQPVESGQVVMIATVIRNCLDLYYDESLDEDLKVMEQGNNALNILHQLTVEAPDDIVSESDMPSPDEWENTSPMASDDEIGLAVSP